MNDTLCQIWIGSSMPEPYRGWCESMRATAEALGMGYRLHGWQDVEARYAANPVMPILKQALQVLDTPTTYALISDWWRLRILADEGGWYADTDFRATAPPSWEPEHDLSFFDEGTPGSTALAAGMIHCKGERGRAAVRLMADEVERRLAEVLPADATDFAARYIRLVRNDTPGRKWSLVHVIGNAVINREILPKVSAAGYTVGAIPHAVASNRKYVEKYGAAAALWHMGAGSWVRRSSAYWAEVAGMAAERDRQCRILSLPVWLRPQGGVELPDLPKVRRLKTDAQEAREALRGVLQAPPGTKRVVVFSNVVQGFPDFKLEPGDWCLHCNKARHMRLALTVPGTQHALLIRHGGRMAWYAPDSLDGVHQVCCINKGSPILRRRWYCDYVRDTQGKYPTTGYIAAHLARELLPGVPVVLCGFDPAGDSSTYHWGGHAWQYEAAQYERECYTVIKPCQAKRTRVLVGICTCHGNKARRGACRATWLTHAAPGVQAVFFAAEPALDGEPDVVVLPVADDYAHLPQKVVAWLRYALQHYDFDWICKLDDDTYCAMDRLAGLCQCGADFVGDRPVTAGFVSGGAGYLMRRAVAEDIVANSAGIPPTGAEDVQITQAVVRLGYTTAHTERLQNNPRVPPAANNDLVTCTNLTPAEMLTIDHTR